MTSWVRDMASRNPKPGQSLQDLRPDLVDEWHPTLNSFQPTDVSLGSQMIVWWQCRVSSDHVWESKVQNRAKQGQGCPFCSGRRASGINNLLSWCKNNGEFGELLLEQFEPELNSKSLDGITVGSKTQIWWKCKQCLNVFEAPANRRTSMRTGCPFCSGHRVSSTNSLEFLFPQIALQWDFEQNGSLLPSHVTAGSNKKIWWKCPNGPDHNWQALITSRTGSKATGCPFCQGLKASVTNSLATVRPELVPEWDNVKNGLLTPSDLTVGSSKKVWWRCKLNEDHSWQAPISNRTGQGQGCPFCSGKRVDHTNSFATKHPHLVDFFDEEKNVCSPDSILGGSQKKFWWKCPNGPDHEWKATALSISSSKTPCPFCPPRITKLSVTNSLQAWSTRNGSRGRQILSEWDNVANKGMSPDEVIYAKQKVLVHWQCSIAEDHRWTSSPYNRTVAGFDCPFCSGRRPSSTNSLELVNPELASALHKTLNGPVDISKLSPTTHEVFWWQCPIAEDHVWRASVNSMKGALRCGFCAGKKVSTTNSLASKFPEIAQEFDLSLNSPLTPNDITFGSGKKYWWRCAINPEHSWTATASSRTGQLKTGCPECVIAPRSRREILLAHEIGSFFKIDQLDHRVKAVGKVFDCDIVLRGERIIIEYDGSFWHKEKVQSDTEKTEALKSDGWKVIRVREEPLTQIQQHDVICSEYEPVVGIAARVVSTISKLLNEFIPELENYERALAPRAQDKAEQFIQNLLNAPDALTAYRQRQTWDRYFHQLEEFFLAHGTSDPATVPGSPKKLITWVNKQRSAYRAQTLQPDFALRLENFDDWHWSEIDFRWRKQFELLKAKMENGSQLGVGGLGQTLASWVVHQRKLFGLGQLDEQQISLLEDLPKWTWTPMEDSWQQAYETLLKFVERTGSSLVPQDHKEEEYGLGVWVNKQRGRYKRGTLDTEKRLLLESLPDWTWSPTVSREIAMFAALESFIAREGHANIPITHIENGEKIGQWLNGARGRRRGGRLSPDLESRLSKIPGFMWEPLEELPYRNVELIEEFFIANPEKNSVGDAELKGRKLKSIVIYLRRHYQNGDLPQGVIQRLESIPNWSWSPFEDSWNIGYSYLLTYVEREGTSLVPQKHIEDEFNLGTWVHGRRAAFRKGSLSENQRHLLESLPGWTWRPPRGPQPKEPYSTN
jgi:hypothetical protein